MNPNATLSPSARYGLPSSRSSRPSRPSEAVSGPDAVATRHTPRIIATGTALITVSFDAAGLLCMRGREDPAAYRDMEAGQKKRGLDPNRSATWRALAAVASAPGLHTAPAPCLLYTSPSPR